MDLARFIWELLGVSQADVVLDCDATETAGGVEAVQILVDAVTQVFFFLTLASKWTLWTDHGFVLLMVTGAGLSQESFGMDQHLHFGSTKRASSCRDEFA